LLVSRMGLLSRIHAGQRLRAAELRRAGRLRGPHRAGRLPTGLGLHTIERMTVPASDEMICSARGCRRPAECALQWNNPKLHAPDRRKAWLACAEHRESLSDFLDRRGFLRDVTAITPSPVPEG
jgi:hypothetical protein